MKLELLPNELFFDLFEYFQILHIFQIFFQLNLRFHTLVLQYCRKCHLDFQSISKTDFDLICTTYLPSFADRIQSLHLSDNDQTPEQINLFLSYGFQLDHFLHLQTLTLSHLHSSSILERLLIECSHLSSLKHLIVLHCHMSINRNHADRLFNQIWSLPNLIYSSIDINFANRNYFSRPIVRSTSLRSISIPNISCYLSELIHLFQYTPNLQDLTIDFIDYVDNIEMTLPIVSITRLKLSFDSSLNVLQYLLQNLPDLYDLTIQTCNIYIDGYQWEEIIRQYLPKLKEFQFKMRFSSLNNQSKEIQSNQILDSFRTKFWIDEHQWFVRCHWYSSDTDEYHLDFIDLFTLPYAFKEFLSYTGCILVKSTCSSEDEYWSYDHVNHLYYGSSHFTSSIMSRIRFSSIQNLSLSLPFNEQFLFVVVRLDQLNSLCISINNNKKTEHIQGQLQILLDRASCLDSLSFGSWSSSASLQVPLMENTSRTILKLNFQGYTCGKNWRYFDEEQCIQLSHSSLGRQCETLLIKVKTRKNILDLINRMSNLRALNVRCEDDHWTNQNNTTEDDLVDWLRDCLPSSFLITRDTYHIHDIRLWIR